METIPVAVADLDSEPLDWRPFVRTLGGNVAGYAVGDRLIAVTDFGAPRGRLVAIPLDSNTADDPSTWQVLVPESDAVLRAVRPVGDVLYLTEIVDTYSRIRVVDTDGKPIEEVTLPARGAVVDQMFHFNNVAQKIHPDVFIFGFSTLTASQAILAHTPGGKVTVLREPGVRLHNTVVEDLWAISKDGTRIPFQIVRRSDVPNDQPQPTLMWGYGAANLPLLNSFPGEMAAFVAVGGVFVQTHLRGGGELGMDWWRDGSFEKKQNTYDDLYAIAEHLIAAKRTTPGQLAVTGRSSGGLLAGVALTQRPDLWGVVIPRFPRADLIAAVRTTYGRWTTASDRAKDPDDPVQARRLGDLSPYHQVRDGVRYPAVYVDIGGTDPRCPPGEGCKLAARLQAASAGDAPIVVHVWENVGHGWADLSQDAEWLAFTLRHLGVEEFIASTI